MKKMGKRTYYIAFFCAVAIALFSLESTMQVEQEDLVIKEIRQPTTRRGSTNETPKTPLKKESSSTHSPEEFIPIPIQEPTEATPLSSTTIEEKPEETLNVSSPDIEKAPSPDTPQENEKKKETQAKEETEFSSIQSSGLTLANGDSWYFEEYDENGNVISIVSYNKKKLLSKSQFEYNEEGKKISATLIEPKKIIKLTFDDKGVEIGRTEYKNKKGQIGEAYFSNENIYNEKGQLIEERTTENGIIKRKVYTYDKQKMISETIFENDVKILFIEYKENMKVIHIFNEETELSVFEEALE